MEHLLNSAFATSIAEIATLPICTVKTNYQNHNFSTVSECVRHIYKSKGLRGFVDASLPAVGAQIISTSSKFFLYRNLQSYNNSDKSPWIRFLNGASSGILSSLITHPMDVVRIHIQMNSKIPWNKPYRGYSKTLGKVIVGSSLFFPIYDYLNQDRQWKAAPSALATAFISTTIMQPLDYAKTRQMFGLLHLDRTQQVKSIFRNYYKGIFLNYSRILPHFTIIMVVIEKLENK